MATDWLEIQKAYAIKRLAVGFWGREGGKKKQKSKASAKVGLVDGAEQWRSQSAESPRSPRGRGWERGS